MTTPGQTAPDGSYVIGGGAYKFGQALTEDMVRTLIMGGLRGFQFGNISDASRLIEEVLRRVPLDGLKMAQPFVPGATDADFIDVDTAVDTIMRALRIREVFASLGQVQSILEKLIRDIVKIFTGFENGLDALEAWWKQIAGLIGLIGNPAGLVALIQDLLNKVFTFLTGSLTHPDKTLKEVVEALGLWFTNTFDALKVLVDNLVSGFQALVDGIWNLFTGSTGIVGKTAAEVVDALKAWLAGPFKLVQDGLAAIVATVQALVDGIANVMGIGTGTGKPIGDAIAAITGILGIGTSAASAAAQANMGVAAILAQQGGGFVDEFDYPLAANLPPEWMRKTTAIADTYGPNGSGVAVGVVSGTGVGPVQYVQVTKPLTAADMKVTAVLARLPWWDLFVKSSWYLLVQASAADRTCYGVDIMNTTCQFFSLNAAGTQTNIGAVKTIPANAIGLPYALEIKGTTLTLYRNGIVAATQTVTAALPGRCVGFGGNKPVYVSATDNPLAHFAGISWMPA